MWLIHCYIIQWLLLHDWCTGSAPHLFNLSVIDWLDCKWRWLIPYDIQNTFLFLPFYCITIVQSFFRHMRLLFPISIACFSSSPFFSLSPLLISLSMSLTLSLSLSLSICSSLYLLLSSLLFSLSPCLFLSLSPCFFLFLSHSSFLCSIFYLFSKFGRAGLHTASCQQHSIASFRRWHCTSGSQIRWSYVTFICINYNWLVVTDQFWHLSLYGLGLYFFLFW